MKVGDDDKSLTAARETLKGAAREEARGREESRETKERGKQKHLAERMIAFWQKAQNRAVSIWPSWLVPVLSLFAPLGRFFARIYTGTYRWVAYPKGPDGNRKFSSRRAASAFIGLVALTIFLPVLMARTIIPGAVNFVYDAGMLAFTREDRLYLGRIDLVDDQRQIYQVMGCRDISGCDGGDNTTYFRLRPNMILGLKYWFTRFEPYDPAEIGGAMVSELNDCSIRYYGQRVKAFGWYPYITAASCKPVGPSG